MIEFEQKKRVRRIIYSKFTIVILLIIFVFLADGAFDVYRRSVENNKKFENESRQLAELEENKKNLENQIEEINTPLGQEEIIRNKFSVAKEGEKAIFIIDKENTESVVPEKERGKISSFFYKIWTFIGI